MRQAVQTQLETPLTKAEVAELHRILDKLTEFVSREVAADS